MPKELECKEPPPHFIQAGRRWSCVRGFRLCSEKGEDTNYRTCGMSQGIMQRFLLSGSMVQGSSSNFDLQLLREALGELVLPEVFRPVPFLGQYQQTVVGNVRQGTWRIKNQRCGCSLMYIHCVWKGDKEQKNGMEFTILHFVCQRSRPQGTVPAAPLVECKVCPSSGSSSLTQACERGKRWGQGVSVEQALNCFLYGTAMVWKQWGQFFVSSSLNMIDYRWGITQK